MYTVHTEINTMYRNSRKQITEKPQVLTNSESLEALHGGDWWFRVEWLGWVATGCGGGGRYYKMK